MIKKKLLKSIEIIPPRYKIDNQLLRNLSKYQNNFDFLDIACSPMANLRISAITFAHNLIIKGIKKEKLIINFSTRDKNTLALQSEILGTYGMGINRLLIVKGDKISYGNSLKSKEVFEVSTNELIKIINNLNNGHDYSSNMLKFKTKFNIGSTLNIDSSYSIVKKTIQKRIKSGSNFFITQPLYSEKDFVLLSKLSKNKSYQILAGILPIKNKKTFVNLIKKINGISKVNELFDLLSGANEKDFADISTKYLLNLLEKYKSELDGVHIMTSGDIRLASKIADKI